MNNLVVSLVDGYNCILRRGSIRLLIIRKFDAAHLTRPFHKARRKTRAIFYIFIKHGRRQMVQRITSHGSKFPLVKVTYDIGTSLAKTPDKRRHVYSPTMLISTKSSWYLGSPRFPPANYKLPEDLQDSADLRNLLTFCLPPLPSSPLLLFLSLHLISSLV